MSWMDGKEAEDCSPPNWREELAKTGRWWPRWYVGKPFHRAV